MSNLKYKVGDKVLIKDINWYNKNKNEDGDISCGEFIFVSSMSKFCGKILTIDVVFEDGTYLMKEDTDGFVFTNEMFDTFAEEEVERLTGNLSNSLVNEFELPDGYIFKDENGNVILTSKIILEKKKEYPKTYEECCKVLGVNPDNFLSIRNLYRDDGDEESTDYERDLLGKFDSLWELRICRDAYWKIAGEEMKLGKPWEPDWDDGELKWCMSYSGNCIEFDQYKSIHHVLAFPTPEMLDAFYENFKELIVQCKELL